jgi:hypothetical protein
MIIYDVRVDKLPDTCAPCPLLVLGTKLMCIVNRKEIKDTVDEPMTERPKWCPLRIKENK